MSVRGPEGASNLLTQGYALASLMSYYGDPAIAVVQPEQRIRWIFAPSPAESLFAAPGLAIAEAGRRFDLVLKMRYRHVEPVGTIARRRAGRPVRDLRALPRRRPVPRPCSIRPARAPRSIFSGTAGRDRRRRRSPRVASGPRPRRGRRFSRAGGRTEPSSLFETGGLRWRFPRSKSPCEAVIVNTGGGVAGGDFYRIALALDAGAAVEATTAAAEKIYRSEGPAARIAPRFRSSRARGCSGCRRRRSCSRAPGSSATLAIDMAADAELIAVETLVFGRLAMGETRIAARLSDSWRLRRGGKLVFADATRIDEAGASLDRTACGAGARAVATLIGAAPDIEARLPGLRAALDVHGAEVEAGASAFDGLIVSRLVSASPSRLREAAIAAILAMSGRQPPRLWR